jgi:hypothetical protein
MGRAGVYNKKDGILVKQYQLARDLDMQQWLVDPEGRKLLLLSKVKAWDAATRKERVVLQGHQVQFGAAGDIPEIGHWLADSIDRIGVFRPSTGTWYLDEFGGAGSYRSGGTTAAYDASAAAVVSPVTIRPRPSTSPSAPRETSRWWAPG